MKYERKHVHNEKLCLLNSYVRPRRSAPPVAAEGPSGATHFKAKAPRAPPRTFHVLLEVPSPSSRTPSRSRRSVGACALPRPAAPAAPPAGAAPAPPPAAGGGVGDSGATPLTELRSPKSSMTTHALSSRFAPCFRSQALLFFCSSISFRIAS